MRGDPKIIRAVRVVTELHDSIVRQTGGELGVRDEAGIYFSLKNIDDAGNAGRSAVRLAALFYHEFAQKHHFFDANKRTAHLLAKLFLLDAQQYFKVRYPWAVPFIIAIAEKEKTVEDTERWISRHTTRFRESSRQTYLKKWMQEYAKIERRGRPPKYVKDTRNW
jgi:death-on-curing protein